MNAVVKMGRPSLYTPELIDEICERLANGEPLAVICRDFHMPSTVTVGNWTRIYPELSLSIAHAREVGWDAIAVGARQTARGLGESTEDVQRDRLIVDTDLKLLAKWDPKRYGDLKRVEMTGADGGAIVVENTQVLDLALLDDGQRDALREILEAARANQAVDVTPKAVSGGDCE